MEPAARDGRVVMAAMDVGWSDIGGWTALLAADRRPGERPRRPGREDVDARAATTSRSVGTADRPGDRRRVRVRSAATAPSPLLTGAAADRDRVALLLARVAARRPERIVTIIAEAPAPAHIVFGTDGWRARIGEDYTFENVRRCAEGVAEYVVERGGRRRASSSPTTAGSRQRALRRGRRRGPPRPRHPGGLRGARRPDPDDLVRGRPARRRGRHRDHGQPQPVDRQRLQGEVGRRAPRPGPTS